MIHSNQFTRRLIRTVQALALLIVLCARDAVGQPVAHAAIQLDSARQSLTDTAVLIIRNRPVMVFRSSIGALTPAERASAASRRISALLDSERADGVTARPISEGRLVSVGSKGVFTITPSDVDTLRGQTLASLSQDAADRLRIALAAMREEASIPHLIRGAALALLATFLFFAALRLLYGVRRLILARLPAVARMRLKTPSFAGFTLIGPEHLVLFVRRLVDFLAWAAGIFVAYLWLAFVLTRFAYTAPWGEALGSYLAATVVRLTLLALNGIPGLFTVVLIFVVTRWVGRLVGSFFDGVSAGTVHVPWVHPETANPTKRIAVTLLWMFSLVVAYPYLPGSGSDVFKGVSVFAGLVLSLGSSGIVNQAMSGLVLMYARALKPGDYVRIADTEGIVSELGMLSTKIRTTKNEEVTLPNALVVAASVKNYSRTRDASRLLVYTSVTIGYDTPWRQVEGMLTEAARTVDGLRDEPSPFVLKTTLSDFYIEYQLNAVLAAPEQRIRVLDGLHAAILDTFNKYGVQITSPHYIADPSDTKVVPQDRWRIPPAEAAAAE